MVKMLSFVFFLAVISCGQDSEDQDSQTPQTDSIPSEADFKLLLAKGDYKQWKSEPSVGGSSIHGATRTFLNDVLEQSQDQQNTEHPVGSIAVKELYRSDGTTLYGYAIEQKVAEGSDGNSWLWYEDLDISDEDVDYYGRDLRLCVGCHSSGTDHVRTSL